MLNPIDPAHYLNLINGEKKAVFEKYFALLTEYNARFNLTAITERADVFEKHFLDSVTGESLFPENASVLEVGSGAGFPSLPLKILRDDLSFTLVESTGKKCEFLKVAVKELALSNVVVLNERAETLARDSKYREKFDICCARAVARLNTLSEYCLPFVKIGGAFVAYKADADEELREAENAIKKLGGKTACSFRYSLPNHGVRTLIQIEKIKPTPALYPRGQGKERKNPL
ncbi:MAG: 16S rRNA (guanine(527)-N(7))-methyltransferase RsmG [Clostridia bacterium]|nr:16S rRNA (guanine(527)-N(7))-methyltransferase RsmG [Clostridia bacterium]